MTPQPSSPSPGESPWSGLQNVSESQPVTGSALASIWLKVDAQPTDWGHRDREFCVFDGGVMECDDGGSSQFSRDEILAIKLIGDDRWWFASPLDIRSDGRASATKSESPIEEAMFVALRAALPGCSITQQLPVLGGKYRLDFAFTEQKIAIECDGHEFHERTKEQAARDRKRDRDLVADGWRVLRFTGSEIHKDAAACAAEVAKVVRV